MEREYANVFTRFAALVIDSLLIVPFYLPIFMASSNLQYAEDVGDGFWLIFFVSVIGGIVFAVWNTIVRMGKTGQSLGRKFLNIAVLDQDGEPIGIGRAFLREVIGRWISGLVCYIGYLNAFWDANKQMWHDKMANCYVYYVEDGFVAT
ncbi:MAG: RDD family protein [bacterium]